MHKTIGYCRIIWKLSHLNFHMDQIIVTTTLCEDLRVFLCMSRVYFPKYLLEWKQVSNKNCRKNYTFLITLLLYSHSHGIWKYKWGPSKIVTLHQRPHKADNILFKCVLQYIILHSKHLIKYKCFHKIKLKSECKRYSYLVSYVPLNYKQSL